MLSRIENTKLELTVVTSLTDTDPDTKQTKVDLAECYRQFLQNNALCLHERLCLCNLCRGKDPVFHDRYLIRYHAEGGIDGFLVTNSLTKQQGFPARYSMTTEIDTLSKPRPRQNLRDRNGLPVGRTGGFPLRSSPRPWRRCCVTWQKSLRRLVRH